MFLVKNVICSRGKFFIAHKEINFYYWIDKFLNENGFQEIFFAKDCNSWKTFLSSLIFIESVLIKSFSFWVFYWISAEPRWALDKTFLINEEIYLWRFVIIEIIALKVKFFDKISKRNFLENKIKKFIGSWKVPPLNCNKRCLNEITPKGRIFQLLFWIMSDFWKRLFIHIGILK